MPELVDLVNKTNARLLYQSLLSNISKPATKESDSSADVDREYELLNAFEMLWNVLGSNKEAASSEEDKSG